MSTKKEIRESKKFLKALRELTNTLCKDAINSVEYGERLINDEPAKSIKELSQALGVLAIGNGRILTAVMLLIEEKACEVEDSIKDAEKQ